MRKAPVMICCICLGLMMIGCGTQTTPEIIMPDQPMTALATDNVAGIGRTVYRYKYKDGYGCCCHYERVYVRGRRNEDKIQV